MSKFIGISGPTCTYKSTIHALLKKVLPTDPKIVYLDDIHDTVWNNLVKSGVFFNYQELTSDRDYLLMYISKLIDYYASQIEKYKYTDNIVIMDGCIVDILVYSMLNTWYHYPVKEYTEKLMEKLLKYMDYIDNVFITIPDKNNEEKLQYSRRAQQTAFKKNRPLECSYYNIAGGLRICTKLTSDIVSNANIIKEKVLEYVALL